MAVEVVGYWNSSYIFDAIDLGAEEQDLFMEQFTTGDDKTDLTLVSRFKFFTMLKDFVNQHDNEEPKEAVLMVQHWYPEAKYVNIEGQLPHPLTRVKGYFFCFLSLGLVDTKPKKFYQIYFFI